MTTPGFMHTIAVKDTAVGIISCLLLFLVSITFPLIGFVAVVWLPFPVLFYRLKLGRKTGVVILAVSLAIMSLITSGIMVDILFYGAMMLTGFFLGECIENHLPIEKIFMFSCLATLGVCAVLAGAWALVNNMNPVSMVSGYLSKNMELTLAFYKDIGVAQETIDTITEALPRIHYIMVRLLPAFFTILLMLVAWFNLLLMKLVLTRKQIRVATLEKLNNWRAPDVMVWVAIGTALLLFIPIAGIRMVAVNVLMVLVVVYFFQGIAIVSFFFEKKGFPFFVRLFFYMVITIQTLFLFIVIGLGFFDTWFNFRKLDTPGDSPK